MSLDIEAKVSLSLRTAQEGMAGLTQVKSCFHVKMI